MWPELRDQPNLLFGGAGASYFFDLHDVETWH